MKSLSFLLLSLFHPYIQIALQTKVKIIFMQFSYSKQNYIHLFCVFFILKLLNQISKFISQMCKTLQNSLTFIFWLSFHIFSNLGSVHFPIKNGFYFSLIEILTWRFFLILQGCTQDI